MNRPVGHVLPDINEEQLNLLGRPAVCAGQRRHGDGRQPRGEVLVAPSADLLVLPVLGPRVHRPLETFDRDIDEADLFHDLGELGDALEGAAEFDGRFEEEVKGPAERAVFGDGVVI